MAVSVIRAEFLFEKSVAADDKFLCLHKKLYRREKPAASSNPARILSQMRLLQRNSGVTLTQEQIPDYNAMISYLTENLGFTSRFSNIKNYCDKLVSGGYIDYFKSDEFKVLVRDSAISVNENFKATGQITTTGVATDQFANEVLKVTKANMEQMMNTYLLSYNVAEAVGYGISKEKIGYVMLNVLSLFKEDTKIARTAYEDAFSSNKDQVKNTETINSAAMIRWIESIKTRYAQLRAAPTPDVQEILEPNFFEGIADIETPSGNYLEPLATTSFERPAEFEEPEPTPEVPASNDSLLIPDMIIEIQRTYNVQKMLMVYNQLPQVMRSDIDSCKLSLSGAFSRCEAIYGAGNCEPISRVAVHQKCPTGYLRQGCCKCVAECDPALYYTTARGFCQHKDDLHHVPSLVSASSASNGQAVNSGLNLAVGACKTGFTLNKFLCYRSCPAGTRAVGGATCLKEKPIILGSPFVWAAGDE